MPDEKTNYHSSSDGFVIQHAASCSASRMTTLMHAVLSVSLNICYSVAMVLRDTVVDSVEERNVRFRSLFTSLRIIDAAFPRISFSFV